MPLPIKSNGPDAPSPGIASPGTLGVIVVCILFQLAVWRDQAAHAKAISILRFGSSSCATGRAQIHALEMAEDYGILKAAGMQIDRDAVARVRLDKMKKASLVHRLSLVAGDFNPVNLATSLFTHVDWLHLVFNLWFLFLVGAAMEKHWGTGPFLGAYLACGLIGEVAFLICNRGGGTFLGVSLTGASGAIAGMMGAFALTRGNTKMTVGGAFGIGRRTEVSARLYFGTWAVGQFVDGFLLGGHSGGAAVSALLAGCLAGLVMGKFIPGAGSSQGLVFLGAPFGADGKPASRRV
ncbi:MAG: Rhomboid family protein [Fibrobacteres bacterium]|nr:Rhomboid family protein [Fibrobacterota bacterium]